MASWIRTYPDASGHVGGVGAYARVVSVSPSVPDRAVFDPFFGVVLGSPGTVDTNAPTRAQYLDTPHFGPKFMGMAGLRFTTDDVAWYPGKRLGGTMFVAPASAFGAGVVPTPNQIRLAATRVFRGAGAFGSPSSRTTAGDCHTLQFYEAAGSAFPPNTKYWVMVCPTAFDLGSTPSIANDDPVNGADTNGRAVSVWTNRTPLAPVITAPVGQTTAFPGSTVELRFSPQDPDRINSFPGDSGIADFEDMAGVQVQYRARPTDAAPDPAWADISIADLTGATLGGGWYMDDLPVSSSNEGAYYVWTTRRLLLLCGDVPGYTANAARLPSGDWQLRVRTFDYGHPFSDSANLNVVPPGTAGSPPLADTSHSYTPDNYPAVNTSPWSEPVRVFISAQVPKPVALSPINSIAVVEGSPVSLVWQYRNTFSPPYTQAGRVVQVRKVGDASWTTVSGVGDASPATSFAIGPGSWAPYPLVSGNQYEWRVQVTDSSGTVSEFSDSAFFWVVPSPGSGVVIDSDETIDGATLGCGTHRVHIYRRGGQDHVGEIRNISSVEWNRVRDDISTAKIVVSGWGIDCGNLLASLQSWAYEVVIFRDNGYSVDRVWEGPITLLTYERDTVVIHAKDVMAYAYRRIIRQAMMDTGNSPTAGTSVTSRAERVLLNAFAPDDPNVLSYLRVLAQPDDAKQYRSIPAYSRTAFEEVDDMAANAGLDYTAVGRAILLWGTKHRIGTLPEFRDEDLGSSPIVSEYGMSMANVYVVSDGNGIYGEATRLDENNKDETYGLVEMLSSTWASESASESGTYTQEGIATIKASFANAAERSIGDRYPPPVVVRVPDNTRLNPDMVLSIRHLVPGVVVPLRSTGTLRTVVASQKLDAVKVIEAEGQENVTVTLSPFSRDDVDAGEGEAEA